MITADVVPPWTVALTDGQHALVQYAVAAAAFCLFAMVTRMWSARREVGDRYRPAVHASVGASTVAAASYVVVAVAIETGYHRSGGLWVPNGDAISTWTARYADWTVSAPLLVVEVVAVSAIAGSAAAWAKRVGGAAAALMIVLGFLGAVVIGGGSAFPAMLGLGIAAAVCFAIVYAVVIIVVLRSLPVLPAAARAPMIAAMVVLLVTWFVYPIMYGLQGISSGGGVTVTEHVLLSGADVVTKVVFGLLILRVARIRTAADVIGRDDVHGESIWIDQLRHSDGAGRPIRSNP